MLLKILQNRCNIGSISYDPKEMCARYKAALLKLSENCISKQSIYLKQFFFLSLYFRWPTDFESSCKRIKISVPSNDRSWLITECKVCFPSSKSLCFGSATAMFLLFWINEFVFVFIAITFSTQTILATRLSLSIEDFNWTWQFLTSTTDQIFVQKNGTKMDFSCYSRLIRNRKFGIRV